MARRYVGGVAPVALETFLPAQRKTSLPYRSWLNGERLLLEAGVDFHGEPRKIATNILSFARRHDWAAVALPVRDEAAPLSSPPRWVQVWGDPSRNWLEGPPAVLAAELSSLGWRTRKR